MIIAGIQHHYLNERLVTSKKQYNTESNNIKRKCERKLSCLPRPYKGLQKIKIKKSKDFIDTIPSQKRLQFKYICFIFNLFNAKNYHS